MAENFPKNELDSFHQEITCPLCLDIYQEPKRLPCDHVYCKGCLGGLAKHSHNGTITCPECRNVAQVPNNDVAIFPTAFQINRLKEVYEKLNAEKQEVKCQLHGQPFALYCETCDDLICRDCLIAIDTHETHKYAYIAASAEKYRKHIEEELESTMSLELTTAISTVTEAKTAVVAQKSNLQLEIDTVFDTLMKQLSEEKSLMILKVDTVMDEKTTALTEQQRSLRNAQATYKSTVTSTQHALEHFSETQLISAQTRIKNRLKSIRTHIDKLALKPVDTPDIDCRLMSPDQLSSLCEEFNFLFRLADAQNCHAKGEGLEYAQTDKKTSVQVHLKDKRGEVSIGRQKLEVELRSIRHNTLELSYTGKQTTPKGFLEIIYETHTRGRHELTIKINDAHIPGSPFSVFVQIPLRNLDKPLATLGPFEYPGGLLFSQGKLYVSEIKGHRLTIIDQDFKTVGTLGQGMFPIPNEMAIDQELNMYISCVGDEKI